MAITTAPESEAGRRLPAGMSLYHPETPEFTGVCSEFGKDFRGFAPDPDSKAFFISYDQRNRPMAGFCIFCALAFLAVPLYAALSGNFAGRGLNLVMASLACAVGIVISVRGAVRLANDKTWFLFSGDTLGVRRLNFWGTGFKNVVFAKRGVADVAARCRTPARGGIYYEVVVRLDSGRDVTVISGDGKQERTEWMAEVLSRWRLS